MLLACIETLAVSYMYKECFVNVYVNVYCFYRLFTYLLATMFTTYTVVHAMWNSSGSIVVRMLSTVTLK